MPLDSRFDLPASARPPMDDQASALLVDGVELGSMGCFLEDFRIGSAELATGYTSVAGLAGALDLTLEDGAGCALPGMRTVEIQIATFAPSYDLPGVKLAVGKLHGKVCEVMFKPLGKALRGRVSVGEWDDSNGWCSCTLTMGAEPYLLGASVSVALANGSTSFAVGCTAPVRPAIEVSAAANAAKVKLTLDGGAVLEYVPASKLASGVKVVFDCTERTLRANGYLAAPTLASDYFELVPGKHTIALTGGTATLSYRELYRY